VLRQVDGYLRHSCPDPNLVAKIAPHPIPTFRHRMII